MSTFNAWMLSKPNDEFQAAMQSADTAHLAETPHADVLIDVRFSTINYKDGLALTNKSPVVRKWPMIPGIDGAGVVIESADSRWKSGDAVVHNGWGVGETAWGFLAQRARVSGAGLIALPSAFTLKQSMAIGTAGYTAGLCITALVNAGVKPESGDVLVTGATGGVGSIAVAVLSEMGYRVVASTGKINESEYLKTLGAAELIDRNTLSAAGKPLQKERWAAVVDSVGSHTLANACAQAKYGAVIAACGLAQGMDFPTTVAPFILRNVQLIGVDSSMCPMTRRQAAWDLLAKHLKPVILDQLQKAWLRKS
jgi:acrylyl-CoA reductase (NADPH)